MKMKRNVVVRLCVSKAERDTLQTAADAENVTLSQFLRSRMFTTVTTVEVLPMPQRPPEKRAKRR